MKKIKKIILVIIILLIGLAISYTFIERKLKQSIAVLHENGKEHSTPPKHNYYSAYKWVEWGAEYYNNHYCAYVIDSELRKRSYDFKRQFRNVFYDSISEPMFNSFVNNTTCFIDNTTYIPLQIYLDSLGKASKEIHDILINPLDVANDLLDNKLMINYIDTIKYRPFFKYLKKDKALKGVCKSWMTFLLFYAEEKKDASYLNCCNDILEVN